MRAPVLAGVFPVFQTPFHLDESIDFATLQREIDFLLGQGAAGLVMAMVSETLRLSHDERLQVAEAACKFSAGRCPVVLSVGAETSRLAEYYAGHATQAGAQAVMAIPPVTTAVDEAGLLRYYDRILRATPLAVIVQDASGYVGRPMLVSTLALMQQEFGERIYFKPEAAPLGPRLSALRDATGGQAKVFEGSGGIALVDSHRRGIVGTMPGAEVVDVIVGLWQALEQNNWPRINQLAGPLVSLIALQTGLDGFLAVEKHLLVKRGIFPNAVVRGPVGFVLDADTAQEVDRLFDLLQELLKQPPAP